MNLDNLIPGVAQAKLIGYGIAAAVVLGMAGTIWWQHSSNVHLTQDLAVAKASIIGLQGTIGVQNKSIEDLRAAGVTAQGNITAAMALAANTRRDGAAAVQAILTAKVPEDCKSAMGWARAKAQELTGGWK